MLTNKTTKKTLAKEVIHFKSLHKIGTGLMFKTKNSCKDKAFLFHLNPKRKYSITMWFVFFKLDIILLDENFKVSVIKRSLKPFTHYNPNCKFKYMVEMLDVPNDVNVGDILEV